MADLDPVLVEVSLKSFLGPNSLITCQVMLQVHISVPVEMVDKHGGSSVPSSGQFALESSHKSRVPTLKLVHRDTLSGCSG
eukprot:6149262-Ditylum_brightwellii.AAC.1